MKKISQIPEGLKPFVQKAVENAPKNWQEVATAKTRRDMAKAKMLWTESCAPKRHGLRAPRIDDSYEWGIVSNKVLSSVLSGFTFVLCGIRGSGKTQIGVEAIKKACKALKSARYVKATEFFMDIRAAYNNNDTDISVIKKYRDYFLLVIDAIEEMEQERGWEKRMLSLLIDYRYDDCKSTILITNNKKNDLNNIWGSSIVSRIAESGCVYECNWQSFRKIEK